MAATLHEMLLTPDVQPQVVADVQALVEQELASKGGISGTAVKVAYKAVTAFAPGYYQETIESMLPDMADQLQPFWADFTASGGAEFGDYLAKRPEEVSRGPARGHRRHGGRLRAAGDHQGVQGGARRCGQEHGARAARTSAPWCRSTPDQRKYSKSSARGSRSMKE